MARGDAPSGSGEGTAAAQQEEQHAHKRSRASPAAVNDSVGAGADSKAIAVGIKRRRRGSSSAASSAEGEQDGGVVAKDKEEGTHCSGRPQATDAATRPAAHGTLKGSKLTDSQPQVFEAREECEDRRHGLHQGFEGLMGTLVSRYPQHCPHLCLAGPSIVFGRGPDCHVCFQDPTIPAKLCELQSGAGPSVSTAVFLKCLASELVLAVNNSLLRKNQMVPLRSGDEIAITGAAPEPYTFFFTDGSAYEAPEEVARLRAAVSAVPRAVQEVGEGATCQPESEAVERFAGAKVDPARAEASAPGSGADGSDASGGSPRRQASGDVSRSERAQAGPLAPSRGAELCQPAGTLKRLPDMEGVELAGPGYAPIHVGIHSARAMEAATAGAGPSGVGPTYARGVPGNDAGMQLPPGLPLDDSRMADQVRTTMLRLFGSLGLGRSKGLPGLALAHAHHQNPGPGSGQGGTLREAAEAGDVAGATAAVLRRLEAMGKSGSAGKGGAAGTAGAGGGEPRSRPAAEEGGAQGVQGGEAEPSGAGGAEHLASLPPDESLERHARQVGVFRDTLAGLVLSPSSLEHGMEAFPHYLSKGTRHRLMSAAFVHLKRGQFAKHTAGLPSMSNKVLLTGPYGSDIYQQKLVRALARDMGARLLVYDHFQVMADASAMDETVAAPPTSDMDDKPGPADKAGMGGPMLEEDDLDDFIDLLDDRDDRMEKGEMPQVWRAAPGGSRPWPSWRKRVRYTQDPSAAGTGAGAPLSVPVPGPASAGHGSSKPVLPGLAGSTLPSGRAAAASGAGRSSKSGPQFKVGDRVRYVGSSSSTAAARDFSSAAPILGLPPSSIAGIFAGLPARGSCGGRDALHASQPGAPGVSGSGRDGGRGPWVGLRGRVVIAQEDNPKKIGVRFDHPVPGGSSLGKRCEDGQGYYCLSSELRPESAVDRTEEANTAATDALFDTALAAAREGPLLVLVKDLEKYLMEDTSRYMQFATRLEAMPPGTPLLLIGSHTADARRERGGSSGIFSRLGSHPLLDLGFIEGLPRLEERARPETSKSIKYLSRLLPNRVTLHAPSEEPAAAEWKRMLEADVASMREASNRALLRSTLSRCGVECLDLDSVVVRDQALTADSIEKVVGWAVAYHLMTSADAQQQQQEQQQPSTEAAEAAVVDSLMDDAAAVEPSVDSEQLKQQRRLEKGKQAASAEQQQPHSQEAAEVQQGVQVVAATAAAVASSGDAADADAPGQQLAVQPPKLQIKGMSITEAVEMLRTSQAEAQPTKNTLKDVATENEFEKRLLAEVIPADEVGVGFDDIGALEGTKQTLREVVMLPLQRPELFSRGSLTKPTKGVLLFGPPGTGKTMLAKAVAAESGANFINASMSSLASKWFGEGEKYVRALFSLAHKIAPSVIFIDEVDSMLGRRDKSGEHEAMRKIKNEFMSNWDGLRTCEADRVLVLAATNRPMDLDEAVIRRMPRRLFVDLPDVPNRIKVLRVILQHEQLLDNFDFDELARLAEGYSGSDLHNLCVAAAYRPIRDFLEAEKKEKAKLAQQEEEAKQAGDKQGDSGAPAAAGDKQGISGAPAAADAAKAAGAPPAADAAATTEPDSGAASQQQAAAKASPSGNGDKAPAPTLRPLTLEDFKAAMEQVGASVSQDAHHMSELKQWNEQYGEGGNRRKTPLPYFM